MGSYYKLVNVAKRQYLCPAQFGEPFTLRWVPGGYHAVALAMLVCGPQPASHADGLVGSWYGDAVDLVSDAEPPDSHGVRTGTLEEPWRNLFAMASVEFEDISPRAIAMLIDMREGAAEGLARQAAGNPYEGSILLRNLGDVLNRNELRRKIDCPEVLEQALACHVGPDWESRYDELVADSGRHKDVQPRD